MKRRIVPGGILALSLAVVLLAATAGTASADRGLSPWYCPPLPTQMTTLDQIQGCYGTNLGNPQRFNFGNRQVGTTSPAQGFALGVFGIDSFNPRISVSGDYAQTNNCPPTLSVTAPLPQIHGCLITVTFTPRGTGPKQGTLSTGPGGPKARLTGNGVTTPTPLGLQLWGRKKQNPQADGGRFPYCERYRCEVVVKVSCGVDACTARATGRLTNVKRDKLTPDGPFDFRPGRTRALGLELRASQRREVRKALDRGENVQAIVTVRATDAAGNVATAKRTIKLVKYTEAPPRPPSAAGAPYNTRVTITQDGGTLHGYVYSGVRWCEVRRTVALFKQQPGTDRKLDVLRSRSFQGLGRWVLWYRKPKAGWHVYALVRREVRPDIGLVCRRDRSPIWTVGP